MTNAVLEIRDIYKSFGPTKVLNGISLCVDQGEFVTLLGSSGCGKTTAIRIIAGLEEPDSGQILLEGEDVTNLPPDKRNVNTVFQNYAIFPHMNIFDNIAYSQKLRGVDKKETARRVEKTLELVQLSGYENRLPDQLSGGQRQRVAIARAVINRPKVLLLDEPLGALDLQLRRQMQTELKELQKRLGITFIYITHDQEEALNMSDRIAVMRGGLFEQIGTPNEIYGRPKSSFVASFVGSSNIIKGTISEEDGDVLTFQNENGCGSVTMVDGERPTGKEITIAIRGENVGVEDSRFEGMCAMNATVIKREFVGGSIHLTLRLKDESTLVSYHHGMHCPVLVGDVVYASWSPSDAVIIDLEERHG